MHLLPYHVEEIHPLVSQPAVQHGWAHNLRATSCTSQIFNQLYIAELIYKLRSGSWLGAKDEPVDGSGSFGPGLETLKGCT